MVKEGESKCFGIESGMRQGCILSPWLFNVYMDAVGWGESGACVIFVLRERIWNALAVWIVIPAFDNTGSLGSPHQVVYPPG